MEAVDMDDVGIAGDGGIASLSELIGGGRRGQESREAAVKEGLRFKIKGGSGEAGAGLMLLGGSDTCSFQV
jgi:hypothetical protein